jgi:hypothetical protein
MLSLIIPIDFRKYWQLDCLKLLTIPEISLKTFIQTLAIVITAVFIFGCPPKHDEPLPTNLLVTSRSEHLVLGNPSGAVDSVSYSTNYLMEKPQYVVTYNIVRGISNWVAWHLDNTWFGDSPREESRSIVESVFVFISNEASEGT